MESIEAESSSARTTILRILNGKGDTKITWDHGNPDDVRDARQTVADLKARGYSFFLVGGQTADEVQGGQGELIARRLTAEEVIDDPPSEPVPTPDVPAAEPPRKRGRPSKKVVAVRPVAGG